MKEQKKLSLKEELDKEGRRVEQEIINNPKLADVEAPKSMDAALAAKIRAYEEQRAKKHTAGGDNVEFSEEICPDFPQRTKDKPEELLSEEDRKALMLGRKIQAGEDIGEDTTEQSGKDSSGENNKSDKGKKVRSIRGSRRVKLIVALAAALVVVLGVGMTSVGSKSYWKELVNGILGKESIQKINVEDMDKQATEDGDELTAYREIRSEIGISVVRLGYKPETMDLQDTQIDIDQRQAKLFYKYKDEIIRYILYTNDENSSFSQKEEDKIKNEIEMNVKNQKILVKEYEVDNKPNPRFIASFEYRGVHYQLKGIMEKEEFVKILQDLKFYS